MTHAMLPCCHGPSIRYGIIPSLNGDAIGDYCSLDRSVSKKAHGSSVVRSVVEPVSTTGWGLISVIGKYLIILQSYGILF